MKSFLIIFLFGIGMLAQDSVDMDVSAKYDYEKCAVCHGNKGEKRALGKSLLLQRMSEDSIKSALLGYRDGSYGREMKGLMKGQISHLSSPEIDELSKYIATFKSTGKKICETQANQNKIITQQNVPNKTVNRYSDKAKVRQYSNDITYAKVLIRNQMLTKEQAQRRETEQVYISKVKATQNEKVVFELISTEYLSKNPILKFKYKSQKGEYLNIEAIDNHSTAKNIRTKIKKSSSSKERQEIEFQEDTVLAYNEGNLAIEEFFGKVELIETNKVQLISPKVGSNGASVPVSIYTNIEAKSITLFALEEESKMKFVCQWKLNENSIIDYDVRIKLNAQASGDATSIRIVIEGNDGDFYTVGKNVLVGLGGVEG